MDHFVSKTNGGNNKYSNLVPCCRRCNSAKGERDINHFRENEWAKRFEDKFGIRFNKQQKEFLKELGFDLEVFLPEIKFYFENEEE